LETWVPEHLEFTENSEFVLFQTFQKLQKNETKLQKNDPKIEFWKLRKTSSNSNVRFKVWNEGLTSSLGSDPILFKTTLSFDCFNQKYNKLKLVAIRAGTVRKKFGTPGFFCLYISHTIRPGLGLESD